MVELERHKGLQMKIPETLCCLDKDEIEDNLHDIAEVVTNAKYICRKCARVARKKKHLCKPKKLQGL